VLFIDDSAENIEGALTAGLDAHHLCKEQDIAAKLGSLLD
jgi:FMN phosphatase YigB (HAD superfamily)